jgi:hypothetical protein
MASGTEMDLISTGGLFAGDHGPDNAWRSEKGTTLSPHLMLPLESEAMGDSRHQTDDINQLWDSTVIVQTPMTGGGGATHQTPLIGKSGKGKM